MLLLMLILLLLILLLREAPPKLEKAEGIWALPVRGGLNPCLGKFAQIGPEKRCPRGPVWVGGGGLIAIWAMPK